MKFNSGMWGDSRSWYSTWCETVELEDFLRLNIGNKKARKHLKNIRKLQKDITNLKFT